MARRKYVRDDDGRFATVSVGKRAKTIGEEGKSVRGNKRAAAKKKLRQKLGKGAGAKKRIAGNKDKRVVTKLERLSKNRSSRRKKGRSKR